MSTPWLPHTLARSLRPRATSTTPAASASSSTSRDASRTRIVAAGAAGPEEPAAPRRVRLRGQHRRRRRHPDPDARRVPPQGGAGRRCRRPANTASAWCSCRGTRIDRAAVRGARSRGSSPRKGSTCSAGATCRPTTRAVGPSARRRRAGLQAAVHRRSDRARLTGADARRAFERKLYVIRKRIEHAADALPIADAVETSSLHRQPLVATR